MHKRTRSWVWLLLAGPPTVQCNPRSHNNWAKLEVAPKPVMLVPHWPKSKKN